MRSLGVASVVGFGALGFVACTSSDRSASTAQDSGFVCPPGVDCRPSCVAPTSCAIDEATCGSTSTCLPMATNQGKSVQDFRMRRVTFTAPRGLSQTPVQQSTKT